jgi:hypothetical protein
MKKRFILLVAIGLFSVLLGCSPKSVDGPYGGKSVEWYVAHGGERAEQLRWCKDQAVTVQMNSVGCSQAATAGGMSAAKGGLPAGY